MFTSTYAYDRLNRNTAITHAKNPGSTTIRSHSYGWGNGSLGNDTAYPCEPCVLGRTPRRKLQCVRSGTEAKCSTSDDQPRPQLDWVHFGIIMDTNQDNTGGTWHR